MKHVKEYSSKEEFFYRPSIAQIMRGNPIIVRTPEEFVDVFENLGEDEYGLVDFDVIPRLSKKKDRDGNLIPYVTEDKLHRLSPRFLNRGPRLNLTRYKSTEEAKRERILPYKDREEKIKSIDDLVELSGYGFWNLIVRKHQIIHQDDCLWGEKIFALSRYPKTEDDIIKIYPQFEFPKDTEHVLKLGADYIIEVPSRTRGKHIVNLTSVPLIADPDNYEQIFEIILNLQGIDTSELHATGGSRRYKGKEALHTPFMIAAYLAIAHEEAYPGKGLTPNRIPISMCPYMLHSQKGVRFWTNILNKGVMRKNGIEYEDEDIEKEPHKDFRTLLKAVREIGLGWYCILRKDEKPFYAGGVVKREKIQEYEW